MSDIAFNPSYFNLWFSLCGLILNVVVMIVYSFESTLPTKQGRCFLLLTGAITLVELLTLWHCIWLDSAGLQQMVPVATERYLTTAEKLVMLGTPLLAILYIMEIYHLRLTKAQTMLMLALPQAISWLTVLSGLFSSFFFHYNERGEMLYNYPQGVLAYANAVVFLCFAAYKNFHYGYTLSIERRVILWLYLAMAILGAAMRIMTGSVSVYEFFLSISTLLYVYTLQNPREYMNLEAGCYNRRGFDYIIQTRLAQGRTFAVSSIYIDDLAILESTMEEQKASEILHGITDFLRQGCGESAEIFRLQSGVFAILTPTAEEGKSVRAMEYVCERFKEPWHGAHTGQVRLSAHACVMLCPKEASDLQQIVEILDQAEVEATRQSKLVIRTQELDMENRMKRRRIANAVKRAIEEHHFEVYYQPIFDPGTKRFTSAEALLRLRDPDMGFISPAEFIPVAERNGMIVQIDKYVLEEVCRLFAETDIRALGIRYIEVNLSVVDCIQSDLADRVMDTMRRYRVAPEEINLEVTETAEEGVSYTMLENIKKLAREGVAFSLDDFGTGYSNLMRMTQMPLKLIKLDKSVVQPAFENDYSYRILLGMIRLIRTLHKEIVAEGVETEEQSLRLIRLNCDHIQGFYYARPLGRDNFLRFLRDKN